MLLWQFHGYSNTASHHICRSVTVPRPWSQIQASSSVSISANTQDNRYMLPKPYVVDFRLRSTSMVQVALRSEIMISSLRPFPTLTTSMLSQKTSSISQTERQQRFGQDLWVYRKTSSQMERPQLIHLRDQLSWRNGTREVGKAPECVKKPRYQTTSFKHST